MIPALDRELERFDHSQPYGGTDEHTITRAEWLELIGLEPTAEVVRYGSAH